MIPFDHTYAQQLPEHVVACQPEPAPHPQLLCFNRTLAQELGLNAEVVEPVAHLWFSGSQLPSGAKPVAQAYAGHQFGGFVPQLGDGRAHLLGEVIDILGKRRDIALKGSGRTPFSRGGDGKAAIGPVLREYLFGEAMHALGIPTTRALAAVATGQAVRREKLLPGAILTRVASSHVRVGTFEFFATRGPSEKLRQLADYVIERHDPTLVGREDRYLGLLQAVTRRQAALIARWMLVGFIHGVMNTDNTTISGETIDYGPCAWMETYRPLAVFSSIDHGGRYAFSNQPNIAQWNLARFAETLLPLICPDDPEQAIEPVMEILREFPVAYEEAWLGGARAKLGLETAEPDDAKLVLDWFALMEKHELDFTTAWRELIRCATGEDQTLRGWCGSSRDGVDWLARWQARLALETRDPSELSAAMSRVNPIYVPRNHLIEEALAAATEQHDLSKFERLLEVVSRPFDERADRDDFAQPAPAQFTSCYKTFCGT